MITIIAPTKNMKPMPSEYTMSLPQFCVEAEELLELLKSYNDEAIMNIMHVNAKMAIQNQQRFQKIRFDRSGTPALLTYVGLVFQSMHLSTWQKEDILFAQEHLRILSGFYGVVRPLDSIYPYRLEMQAKGLSERIDNLYTFWSDSLMRSIRDDNTDDVYINLASKEYAQAVMPYRKDHECFITIDFQMIKNNERKTITTYAKTARGNMVEYIMKKRINDPLQIKAFHYDGWHFDEALSNDNRYVFLKEKE